MKSNSRPLVSVIIPVWNPGPQISRCIESLRKQALEDIEMIFVDDRGQDDAADKVREAAAEDPRIRIIENEKNMGAGISRNIGIEAAKGEYLSFVDPDDYIEPDFLEKLYAEADRGAFDIVKGSIVRKKEDDSIFPGVIDLNSRIRQELSEGHSLFNSFTYEHQSAIYRRNYLVSNNVRYGTSSRAQDNTFLLQACSQVGSFSFVDDAHYCFCERSDSAMHIQDADRLQGYLVSVTEQVDHVIARLLDDRDILQFLRGLFQNALKEYARYDSIPAMEKEAEDFLLGLRSELMRLPCCDSICEMSFPLTVLRDHSIGLPKAPFATPWEGREHPIRYAELAKRWTDFYLSHPEEANACSKDIAQVYRKALAATAGRAGEDHDPKEIKQGAVMVKEQLKRLPRKLRIAIKLSFIGSYLSKKVK